MSWITQTGRECGDAKGKADSWNTNATAEVSALKTGWWVCATGRRLDEANTYALTLSAQVSVAFDDFFRILQCVPNKNHA